MGTVPARRTRSRPRPVRTRRPLRSAAGLVAALVVSVVFSAPAQAAPGDLDLTFSGDGKQTTPFGFGGSNAAAIVRQADGKLVVAGTDTGGDGGDFVLARYNPSGSLDTSFSGDGRQRTDFGTDVDQAAGVALQGNGKIVVVGSGGPNADFAIARYNTNGSLDTSFSGDGKETTDFGAFDLATDVAIQSDGKIVAVGRGVTTSGTFALARYNTNGSLDTTFSGDGKQTTVFPGGSGEARGVALQGNGKIVVAGSTNGNFALARYNTNGSPDTTFSGDGKLTTDFGGSEFATALVLQTDGKIVAAGVDSGGFALARYNPNGSLDTSFSGDGKQTTDLGANGGEVVGGVALQADAKIVVVGRGAPTNGFDDFGIVRYNPNGSLDTTFSGDGIQTTDFGGFDSADDVAIQPDGKIVAAGVADTSGINSDFALARYNPNGSLDATFSGDGKERTDFGGPDAAAGLAIQDDGKIVTAGFASGNPGGGGFALARYNPNGSLDVSFSGDGKQTTDFGGSSEFASGLALQDDGKILAVGDNGVGDFALARYNPNGSLDTTFSGDGKQTTDFGGFDGATGVAVQGDGKIVVVGGGASDLGGRDDFTIARYNPNGSLDTTFSGDGKQTTDFGGFDDATAVALQSNGKIVAVGGGVGTEVSAPAFALARYNPNGSLDTSFSGDGKQTTGFGDIANGVALQANGKIVAVGHAGQDFGLARYNPNGSLDTTFSGDGLQTTDFGFGADDEANGVALQGDGKIVAAGFASGGATGRDFALARYNTNGSLDATFSGDGRRRTDFGGNDGANGVALQANGRIVLAGGGLGSDQTTDFALARYLSG
jgi:uncharacterized delta-60 repeat protein